MKKKLIVLMTSIIVVTGLVLNVQAANVSFNPNVVLVKVMPGDSASSTLTAHGFSSQSYFLNLSIGSKLENSNIPQGWITPVNLNLVSRTGGRSASSVNLSVDVPPGTKAGYYSGMILPEDLHSSEPVSSGRISVRIEVIESQEICSGLPVFSDFRIMPESVWAPADRDVEIDISGVVSVANGCDVTAGYAMESNNGFVKGDITLDQDGNFSENFVVNISRSGRDKNGKVFDGELFAVDQDGNMATLQFHVTVLHDKGNKSSQNK
jgi:hypothetical protein